jgi:hypothetical protein
LDGIANEKIRDPRTGRMELRRFVPSNPELREWLNHYTADLHQLAKSGEIAARPIEALPLVPIPEPPTPDEIARVWQQVNEIKQRCNRVLGIPTAEERRECAARILEAARQQD